MDSSCNNLTFRGGEPEIIHPDERAGRICSIQTVGKEHISACCEKVQAHSSPRSGLGYIARKPAGKQGAMGCASLLPGLRLW